MGQLVEKAEAEETYKNKKRALTKMIAMFNLFLGTEYKILNPQGANYKKVILIPIKPEFRNRLKEAINEYMEKDLGTSGFLISLENIEIETDNKKPTPQSNGSLNLSPEILENDLENAHHKIGIPGFLVEKKSAYDFTYQYMNRYDASEVKSKMLESGNVEAARTNGDVRRVTYTLMTERNLSRTIPNYRTWLEGKEDSIGFRMELINFLLECGFGIAPTEADPKTGFTARIHFNKENRDNRDDFIKACKLFSDSFGLRILKAKDTNLLCPNSVFISLDPKVDSFKRESFSEYGNPKELLREIVSSKKMQDYLKERFAEVDQMYIKKIDVTQSRRVTNVTRNPAVGEVTYDEIMGDVKTHMNRLMVEIGIKRTGVNLLVQKTNPEKGMFRVSLNTKSLNTDEKKSAFGQIAGKLPDHLQQYVTSTGATVGFTVPIDDSDPVPQPVSLSKVDELKKLVNESLNGKLGITSNQLKGEENGVIKIYLYSETKDLLTEESVRKLLSDKLEPHFVKLEGTNVYFKLDPTPQVTGNTNSGDSNTNSSVIAETDPGAEQGDSQPPNSSTEHSSETDENMLVQVTPGEEVSHVARTETHLVEHENVKPIPLNDELYRKIFKGIPPEMKKRLLFEELGLENTVIVDANDPIESLVVNIGGVMIPLEKGFYSLQLKPKTLAKD
ncbi:hypothetical protein KC866_03625 [Patescibacteria group bacterium]|nr:hypothetical protein [Patescibacteria group bacterium]